MTGEYMFHPEIAFFWTKKAQGTWQNPGEIRQDIGEIRQISKYA